VMSFPIEAVELSEGRMILRTLKRGRPVTLGLHPALQDALESHLAFRTSAQKASPFVFTTSKGKVSRSIDHMLAMLFQRCGIVNGHPHRFRDTFAVRLLQTGASLYDVAKLLGINVATAERHYAPYVRELQERATKLIGQLTLPGQKVVQFCVPQEATEDHFDQRKSEDYRVFLVQKGAGKS
jgi:integrase